MSSARKTTAKDCHARRERNDQAPSRAAGRYPWRSANLRGTIDSMGEAMPGRVEVEDGRGTVLRASWHADEQTVVISLWRAGLCIGTYRATAQQAKTVGSFLARLTAGEGSDPPVTVQGETSPGLAPDRDRIDATGVVPVVRSPRGSPWADTA